MFQDVIDILLQKKVTLREEIEREFAERSQKIDALLEMAGYQEEVEEVAEEVAEEVEEIEEAQEEIVEEVKPTFGVFPQNFN